jgi:hypothetical protein
LDVLYEGLGIGKLQFLKKRKNKLQLYFLNFLVVKSLDPESEPQPDSYPYPHPHLDSINPDPQHWIEESGPIQILDAQKLTDPDPEC